MRFLRDNILVVVVVVILACIVAQTVTYVMHGGH